MKLAVSAATLAIALGLGVSVATAAQLVKDGEFTETSLPYSSLISPSLDSVTDWTSSGYNFDFLPLTTLGPSCGTPGTNCYGGANQGSGYTNGPPGRSNDLYLYGYGQGSQTTDIFNSHGVLTGTKAPGGGAFVAPGGNFIAADGDYGGIGTISQTISHLVVNNTYTLTFSYAFAQQLNYSGATDQDWKFCLDTTCYYTTASGTALSTHNHPTDPFPTVLGSKAFSGWKTETVTFVASLQTEVLSFAAQGKPVGGGSQNPPFALVADVSLDGAAGTPEPSTWAMMLLGVGAVGGLARRRRRVAAVVAA